MGKGAAVLALVAAALLTAACGSSSKPSALQSLLEKHDGIRVSPLPPHATTISEHEAEKIASSTGWITPPGKRPRPSAAGLWRVTDPQLYIPEHGTHRLLVNNQVDWIVLVRGVDITGVCDTCQTQPKAVYGTAAVVINAESGKQIGWWTLPRRPA